jgi:[protein-PII] uridylyltransferase
VRFLEDARGNLSVLEIETGDRSGLLWAITRALFEQQVQIISSRVRTEGGLVHDSFTITELDGSAISPDRRLTIQVALMAAVQPQLSAPPPEVEELESPGD